MLARLVLACLVSASVAFGYVLAKYLAVHLEGEIGGGVQVAVAAIAIAVITIVTIRVASWMGTGMQPHNTRYGKMPGNAPVGREDDAG